MTSTSDATADQLHSPAPEPTLLGLVRTRLLGYLASGPVTLAIIAGAWLIHAIGIDAVFGPHSYVEKVLISGLSTQTVLGLIPATCGLLVLGISAERALGTWRYLLAALLSHALAVSLAVMIGETWDSHSGWAREVATGSILTPAVWLLAVSMLAAPRYPVVWRRRVQFFAVVTAAVLVLYSGTLQDVALALAVCGCGLLTARHWDWQATVREQRRINATTVMAVVIGPYLAGLNPHSDAVFSALGRFVATPEWSLETAREICATARHSSACTAATSAVHVAGLGPFLGNAAIALVFAVLCYGLAKGRRRALIATVLMLLATAGVVVTSSSSIGIAWLPFALQAVALVLQRHLFNLTGSDHALRRALAVLAAVGLALSALWLALVPSLLGLRELPWRFLPPVLSKFSPTPLLPETGLQRFSYEWTSVIFWTVVALMLWRLFTSPAPSTVPAAVRRILREGTGDHISWMSTWPHNCYWVAEKERGFVAYRVHGTVAVTVGAPVVREPAEWAEVADEFESYARGQGWRVAWYSVNEDFAATRAPQYCSLHVAEESVVSVGIEFKGKKFQDVRTARNRAAKENIHYQWTTWSEASPVIRAQIHALSEQWVSEKALPEMGFTLGSVSELIDDEVQLLIAVDDTLHVHGVTSWLPVRQHGEIVGITLDFMRRDREGFRPVVEFLIAEAITTAPTIYGPQLEWVSLSGAPLAGGDTSSLLGMVLSELGGVLEPLYGFRSLAAFKRKFKPMEHSWLLCYDDASSLPAIGLAVSRCYLPHVKLRDAQAAAAVWAEAKAERKERQRAETTRS
ncbi:Lysylphosphatidylglycerol biosynthesis bifunctional protein LysX [Corynebacterium ciconiae DSM 44920]|uniref:bifunctional lysylphosphatidylglycerol flippase/synthetase MprF n=1 Tax=Corynebacterium ciconiae TaxID=227319 RepID=UPI0003631984|nr:DUF2156 domain-containing protein [Corynebacterium ciconiae]WKD60449.1 Lysylphosphatidylglycerol biosynthesis bifunctional protein LysX [Corynebacterium ciconiae DSM 44920]